MQACTTLRGKEEEFYQVTWEHNLKHTVPPKIRFQVWIYCMWPMKQKILQFLQLMLLFNSGAGDLDDLGVVHAEGEDELPLWYCRV